MRISVELDTSPSRKGSGGCVVRLVFTRGKERARHPVVTVQKEHWDPKARRMEFRRQNADLVNAQIEAALARAQRLVLERPHLSPSMLREAMRAPDARGMTFAEAARKELEANPPRSWHTQRARSQLIARFEAWAGPVGIEQVDADLVRRFRAHVVKGGAGPNSASEILRRLRAVYNRTCKLLKVVPRNIVDGVEMGESYDRPPVVFTPKEVGRLVKYAEGQEGWKSKAVHMWLFSLYAGGMRFTDLCRLTPENVRDGRVVYSASKTGKPKNVPLRAEARAIVKRYAGQATVFGVDPAPASIVAANVVANRYLKVAAKACGITKRLTTHNARHSFAAWALNARLDDRAIQQIMGIDDKAFKHYRSKFGQEVLDRAMGKVFKRR